MLKNSNRFASNGVFHALQKTGFVGAGVNGRHRVDLSEFEKRKGKKDKPKGKKLFDEEPDEDEVDPKAVDNDMDDMAEMEEVDPVVHMKKIAKHAKTLKKVSADIGHRIVEMHKMGLK